MPPELPLRQDKLIYLSSKDPGNPAVQSSMIRAVLLATAVGLCVLTSCTTGPRSVYDDSKPWTAWEFNGSKQIHGDCKVQGDYIVSCTYLQDYYLAQIKGLTPPYTVPQPAPDIHQPGAVHYQPDGYIDPAKEWRRSMFYDPVSDTLVPWQ